MSAGFGYQQHEGSQQSDSYTGIAPQYKGEISQRANEADIYAFDKTRGAYGANYGTFNGQTGADMLGLDPTTGLPRTFAPYLASMAQNAFSKASAGGAMRGQMSPESTNEIVASAIRGMGVQALPYVSQFATQAATLPEQVRAQRLGYLQADQATRASLLGGQSSGSGSQYGYGVQVSGGATSGKGP